MIESIKAALAKATAAVDFVKANSGKFSFASGAVAALVVKHFI